VTIPIVSVRSQTGVSRAPAAIDTVATVLFDKFSPNATFDGIDKADAIQIIIAEGGLYGIGVHKLELLP